MSKPSLPLRFSVKETLSPYFNGAYSVHWFFSFVLAGIVVFIIVFAKDTEAILLKQSQMPLVELYDFTIYETTDDEVELQITGEKALRFTEYEQSFETILQKVASQKTTPQTTSKEENPSPKNKPVRVIEYVYGQEILRENNLYTFNKGGVYAKNTGEVFYSKRAKYDMSSGIFTGEGEFWASSVEGSMQGQNLIYNQHLQTATASNATARIDLQNSPAQDSKAAQKPAPTKPQHKETR